MKEKTKRIILTITGIILGLGFLGGFTYAWFSTSLTGNPLVTQVTTGTLSLLFTGGETLEEENILPGWTGIKQFSVENTGTVENVYTIYFNNIVNTFDITEDVQYKITSTTTGTSAGETATTGGDITEWTTMPNNTSQMIIEGINILPGETHTYTLTIRYKETGDNQNEDQGSALSLEVFIEPEEIRLMTIRGVALRQDSTPCANCEIEAHSDPITTSTNAQGEYELVGIQTGRHTITLSDGDTELGQIALTIIPGSEQTYKNNILKVKNNLAEDVELKVNGGLLELSLSSPCDLNPLCSQLLADNTVLDSSIIDYTYTNNGDYINPSFETFNNPSKITVDGLYSLTTSNIYATTEKGETIYFFRGTHNLNNNVIFAGYCWKIVRTNYDGSVKLIYNGTPTSGECTTTTGLGTQLSSASKFNSDWDYNAYVGYTYGTPNSSTYNAEHGIGLPKASQTDSTIKGVIDSWYEGTTYSYEYDGTTYNFDFTGLSNKLINYEEYLADPGYCNDRSIDTTDLTALGYGMNQTAYMALNRLWINKTPSLTCPNEENDLYTKTNTEGNQLLNHPIALLTADEVALAGGGLVADNKTYYLYTDEYYWLLSPTHLNEFAYMWFVNSWGSLNNKNVNYSRGVRPAVSLNASATVLDGTGSMIDPYIIG